MRMLAPHSHLPAPLALDGFLRELLGANEHVAGRVAFPVNVRDTAEGYELHAIVPGVPRGAIEVQAHDGKLTIRATPAELDEKAGWSRIERLPRATERTFQLPKDAQADQISATHADGVLIVHLPKTPDVAPRRIEVQSAG